VAAIFALMTKVGVYAIIRVSSLVFAPGAGVAANTIEPWLFPAALATIVLGTVGAAGATEVRRVQGYLLIASVGTMLAAASAFTVQGLTAALFYMSHSTVATAAMFLLGGLTPGGTGATPRVGALFFVGATMLAGLPPFSGFVGKVLILQAAPAGAAGVWLWSTILGSSVVALVALARAGIALFWTPSPGGAHVDVATGATAADLPGRAPATVTPLAAAGLLCILLALTILSGPASAFAARTAQQLLRPGDYVRAVLGTEGGR
jgi:multicomponent K+:H+ antiporter subunit D